MLFRICSNRFLIFYDDMHWYQSQLVLSVICPTFIGNEEVCGRERYRNIGSKPLSDSCNQSDFGKDTGTLSTMPCSDKTRAAEHEKVRRNSMEYKEGLLGAVVLWSHLQILPSSQEVFEYPGKDLINKLSAKFMLPLYYWVNCIHLPVNITNYKYISTKQQLELLKWQI